MIIPVSVVTSDSTCPAVLVRCVIRGSIGSLTEPIGGGVIWILLQRESSLVIEAGLLGGDVIARV